MDDNIILTGDFSSLQAAFDNLMQSIADTRAELEGLKKGSEEYKNASNSLQQQEMELLEVMNKLGDRVDMSNQSYQNLSKTFGDLNKMSKQVSLNMRNQDFSKPLTTFNNALKQADANIGVYNRKVGDYTGGIKDYTAQVMEAGKEVNKQSQNFSRSISLIFQELPSLANSPEQFLMAISNNIPFLIESFGKLRNATVAQKDAQNALNAATNANTAQNEVNVASQSSNIGARNTASGAIAGNTEAIASNNAALAANNVLTKNITDNVALLADITAMLTESMNVNSKNLMLTTEQFETLRVIMPELVSEWEKLNIVEQLNDGVIVKTIGLEDGYIYVLSKKSGELQKELVQTKLNNKEKAESVALDKQQAAGAAAAAKSVGTFGSFLKGLLNPVSLIIIAFTVLLTQWDKIKKIFNKTDESTFERGSKSIHQWNTVVKEGSLNAAKAVVELKAYNEWAQMIAKSDEERNLAARRVLETLGETVNETNIAAVKTGEYRDQVDALTLSLIRQAQAQGVLEEISNRFKKVIEANADIADKMSKGVSGWNNLWANTINALSSESVDASFEISGEDIFEEQIKKLKYKAEKELENFNNWLTRFLEIYNPSDLIEEETKGRSNKGADDWYSKWEKAIQKREAELQKSNTLLLEYTDKEYWKYTEQGKEYYDNMFAEYLEHYADDEKATKDWTTKKIQYYTEMALYIQKLNGQYMRPDREADFKVVEEWYELEVQKYKDLGIFEENELKLRTEYAIRIYDVEKKYRDKYRNTKLSGQQLELTELAQWFEDEKILYIRQGIDITNLTEEYEKKQMEIRDKYRKQDLDSLRASIQDKYSFESQMYDSAYGQYESIAWTANRGNDGGYQVGRNIGLDNRNREIEVENEQHRMAIESFQQELDAITETLKNAETNELKTELLGEQLDIQRQMELENAQYQMNLDKMVAKSAQQLYEERTQAVSESFRVVGENLTAISGLMEEGTEEAKGFAAAGAAMSAIASAVEAYKSVVGVPYVGPILAPIAAATALLAGAAQIKQIYAVKTDGSNAMSAVNQNAYVGAMPSEITNAPYENVRVATGENELAQLNKTQNIRAYVVDKDLSDGLNSYNSRKNKTSF